MRETEVQIIQLETIVEQDSRLFELDVKKLQELEEVELAFQYGYIDADLYEWRSKRAREIVPLKKNLDLAIK